MSQDRTLFGCVFFVLFCVRIVCAFVVLCFCVHYFLYVVARRDRLSPDTAAILAKDADTVAEEDAEDAISSEGCVCPASCPAAVS